MGLWVLREVARVLDRYGLLHPRELAEAMDIPVVRAPLRVMRGVALGGPRPYVVLAADLEDRGALGALLHEVGHRVLHPGWNRFEIEWGTFFRPEGFEMEAHLFALFYLMAWDAEGLEQCGGDLARFAGRYGLPYRAAEAAARVLEAERARGGAWPPARR